MKRLAAVACRALFTTALLWAALPTFAFADTTATTSTTGNSVADLFLTGVLAFVPSLVISLWAWFKSHAAASSAKWDDEAVAFVRQIAQGVVNGDSPTAAGKVTDH